MIRLLLPVLVVCFCGSVIGGEIPSERRLPPGSLVENFGGSESGIADEKAVRAITPFALELIQVFEGWVPTAYDDAVGYCTIGFGHLIALARCENADLGKYAANFGKSAVKLTEAEGAALLEADTLQARAGVQRLVTVDLSDGQFGALTSFAFNVGVARFAESTLLRLVNDEKFDLAKKQFGRWITAKGNILPGLVERRSCEAELFAGALDMSGHFDRDQCGSLGVASDVGPLIDILEGEL